MALLAIQASGARTVLLDSAVAGVLTNESPRAARGRRAEVYGFQCIRLLAVRISVEADWDNLLLAIAPDGRVVRQDDDSGPRNNARIDWTCPDDRRYGLGVAAYHDGTGGSFTLRVAATNDVGRPALPPPFPRGSVIKVVASNAIETGALTRGSARYLKHPINWYGFYCRKDRTISIDLWSEYDNLLFVFSPAGRFASNDDANGTAAALLLRCPGDGAYRIGVAGQNPDDLGPYRLTVRDLSHPQR